MACAACGRTFCRTIVLERVTESYSEEVYRDFKERNYEDNESICTDCLDECEESLNGD